MKAACLAALALCGFVAVVAQGEAIAAVVGNSKADHSSAPKGVSVIDLTPDVRSRILSKDNFQKTEFGLREGDRDRQFASWTEVDIANFSTIFRAVKTLGRAEGAGDPTSTVARGSAAVILNDHFKVIRPVVSAFPEAAYVEIGSELPDSGERSNHQGGEAYDECSYKQDYFPKLIIDLARQNFELLFGGVRHAPLLAQIGLGGFLAFLAFGMVAVGGERIVFGRRLIGATLLLSGFSILGLMARMALA